VFTALAHGVVEAWSVLLFEIMVWGLTLVWAGKAFYERQLTIMIPQPLWSLVALLALGILQGLSFTDGEGTRHSLSMDAEATRGAVMLLCCLLACALLAANFLTTRERLEKLARWMIYFGLALAVFGLIQHFTWNGKFYWLRPVEVEAPFGPYVNRNHFAGYIELLMPWPVAMMLVRRKQRWERMFYAFAAAWMGIAVVMSLSRGGMISLIAELIFIGALSLRVGHHRPETSSRPRRDLRGRIIRLAAVGAVLLTIIWGVLWLGAERVINRIATGQETDPTIVQTAQTFASSRGELWRGGWGVFCAHPVIGVGLGAFETAYPMYSQDRGLDKIAAHAHNDYLQVLTDSGVVGGLFVLWFIVTVGWAVARGIRSRDPFLSAVTLACGAGIFGLLVHSLFDFNLQLPSHALLFLIFAAIVWQIGTGILPTRQDVIAGRDL
ncbi:MAG TPA: O-antigen ligase family protein, partial [Blastocatellia bacterium]|nr:O-antigen ligase family protein [Blastocatellia bacterium]